MPIDHEGRNLLDSAAEHLPKAAVLESLSGPTGGGGDVRLLVALPAGQRLEVVDTEDLMPNPRRITANATADSLESFVDYVKRHARPETVVWVKLDPETHALTLVGRIDEHDRDKPSWRCHSVSYTPRLSVEWKAWKAMDSKEQAQLAFALFIEHNTADIATVEGKPTAAEMLEMAVGFEAVQDSRVKSHLRLQNGGAKFEFVGDDDDATVRRMELFGSFAIGIPVFWGGDRYRIDARLRYRAQQKVLFWYELVRADRVHETAARELVAKAAEKLGEGIPVLMGNL